MKRSRYTVNEIFAERFLSILNLQDEGNTSCERFVGWMFFFGRGAEVDTNRAQEWFEKAALKSDVEAQFGLGRVYARNVDYENAYKWFQTAADSDFLPARYRLGWLYQHGHGVNRDEMMALDLFEGAADKGHIMARRGYAGLLLKGHKGSWGRIRGAYSLCAVALSGFWRVLRDPNDQTLQY